MKRIQNIKELLALDQELPDEFIKYLEDEFLLESYQAMILLEGKEELNKLVSNHFKLEFTEEVKLESFIALRIGILSDEDVQLYYMVKSNPNI
ncbi:hypothetical protein [Paraliobacillus sp. JSM ZJ581]|uniref:hypothetical protein n=1 Tax=Paraliobacillus sp. JSM ZJ581 TaxID=3342118 RepID=UPI0035A8EBBC